MASLSSGEHLHRLNDGQACLLTSTIGVTVYHSLLSQPTEAFPGYIVVASGWLRCGVSPESSRQRWNREGKVWLFYSEKLIEAFAFSMLLHQDDKKMGHPILSHVLEVVSLILHFGGDEDTAIAGMLHDTNERAKKPVLGEIKRSLMPMWQRSSALALTQRTSRGEFKSKNASI